MRTSGIRKHTVGWVTQTFDEETGELVEQEFCAGDQVDWEDEDGNPVDAPKNAKYQPFDMVQPEADEEVKVNVVLESGVTKAEDTIANADTTVNIIMEGGVIQDVKIGDKVREMVTVRVVDYDEEGDLDEDGNKCKVNVW